jgi:hypothetical protein
MAFQVGLFGRNVASARLYFAGNGLSGGSFLDVIVFSDISFTISGLF